MKTYKKGVAVNVAKNFKSTEFDCHGKNCCTETPIDETLVEILQKVRNHFGVSVTVNSGYRCPVHNANVGGASKTSNHMKGTAADIVVKGVHPVRVARYLEAINVNGRIGCYTYSDSGSGFVHVDTCGKKSRAYYTEDNSHYDTVGAFSTVVKKGSKGRVVKVVQRKLAALGLYTDTIDGISGANTEKAIIKFNALYGRQNDAVWGAKCWGEAFPIN